MSPTHFWVTLQFDQGHQNKFQLKISQFMRFWYLTHLQVAKAKTSLRKYKFR